MASTVISRISELTGKLALSKKLSLKKKSYLYIRFYGAVTTLLSGADGFWRENNTSFKHC